MRQIAIWKALLKPINSLTKAPSKPMNSIILLARRVKHRKVGKSPWDAGHVVAARSGSAAGGMTTKRDLC
jgi:hypothetical protein